MSDVAYTYCETASSLDPLILGLQSCSMVVLDCEGVELGTKNGTLTVLTLRPESTFSTGESTIYIVDLIALSKQSLTPIIDLLNDKRITKLVFDGRMDHLALRRFLGVDISENALDMQVATIMKRTIIDKEPWYMHRGRLRKYVGMEELKAHPEYYKQVHRLPGLNMAIEDSKIATNIHKGKGELHSAL
jgi:exonuclease 3'-5' domain-containing protein 1